MEWARRSRSAGGRATIVDVARRAGVSRQTVSNVLAHPARVRATTATRVQKAIDELGYHPSSSAQSLRSRRSGAVGVEVNALGSRVHNETVADFLGALSIRAAAHGCHLVPFGSPQSSPMLAGYTEMLARGLVDAFIVADTHHEDPRPEWLTSRRVPFAAFGRVWDHPGFTRWVDVDGGIGAGRAVTHCVERGYRTVAFLGWPAGSPVGDDRRAGWRTAALRAGADVLGPEAQASQDLDAAKAAAYGLIAQLGPGDAVVCASDVLALGVHQVLLESGRAVGKDMGVVGFDGSRTATMHHLTTIAQPLPTIADQVLTQVHDALEALAPPATGVLLEPVVVADASTDPSHSSRVVRPSQCSPTKESP